MAGLAITSFHAGLFALLFVGLSLWVSLGRARYGAHHGDAGRTELQRRIRSQANFAEYVPFALLLIALLEAGGSAPATLHALLAVLLAARIAHPFGMIAPEGSAQQYALRAPAIVATWGVMLTSAFLLLTR